MCIVGDLADVVRPGASAKRDLAAARLNLALLLFQQRRFQLALGIGALIGDVEGHLTHLNAVVADEGLFKAALNPENDCSGTVDTVPGDPSTRYDSETNPAGVRCSVLDIMVNLLGRRPESSWSPQEQAAGYGFAGIPFATIAILFPQFTSIHPYFTDLLIVVPAAFLVQEVAARGLMAQVDLDFLRHLLTSLGLAASAGVGP